MVLPNVSVESMPTLTKKYGEEQVFSCISTNNFFHGTMWPTLKRASFVLWNNHTTKFSYQSPIFNVNVTLSFAGIYLFSETDADFTLTASNPHYYIGHLNLIVGRVGYGDGCTVSSDPGVASTNVTCKKRNTNE